MHVTLGLTMLVPVPSAAASLTQPDSVATVTTDTGAFAPGHKTFTRYSAPGICVAAALDASDVLRRSLTAQAVLDTIRETAPTRDTLPAGVAAVARVCGAHFTIAGTAVQDLPDLFTLALLEHDDSLAHLVVQRRVALAAGVAARDTILLDAISEYLAAEPARVTAAGAMVAQMDALGSSTQIVRLKAHGALLAFATSIFDTVHMRQEADRIIAVSHKIPATAGKHIEEAVEHNNPVARAYAALADIAFIDHPDSIVVLMQRAKQDLSRLFPSYAKSTLAQVQDRLFPAGAFLVAGDRPPPVEAKYWVPKKPDPWPPRHGVVSLVIDGGMWQDACVRDDGWILTYSSSDQCTPLSTYIRRWAAQYGNHGLAITLVTHTQGYAVRSTALLPAAEAQALGWYFRDYLKLPVTLAVTESAVQELPPPDGRRVYTDTTSLEKFKQKLANDIHPLVMLVGRDGQLLYAENGISPFFEALLARAMTTPATAASLPSVSPSLQTTP